MHKSLASKTRSPLVVPISLLVVCVLAYGLLIPSLGFYWDDLPYALVYHRFGPSGYPTFVASDRPYSAWVFMGLTWLLGAQPMGYHVFGLLLYWLCVLLFWGLVRQLWPSFEQEALWAALLFAIYPGFLGQPKTIIYNHHFSAMALYLFSLIATIRAIQAPSGRGGQRAWLWHLPAILTMSLSQFTIEYYVGWEAVRFAAVWFTFKRQDSKPKRHWVTALLHLAPYWLATIAFLIWRALIFRFPTYQPVGSESMGVAPIVWLENIFAQVVDAVFLAWGRALPHLSSQDYSRPFWLVYLLLTLVSIILTFLFLYLRSRNSSDTPSNAVDPAGNTFGWQALVMSLVGIGFAGWPFWLVDLQLSIESHFRSRFTLAFIPWVALLLAVLLHYLGRIRFPWMKIINSALVAVLVGGSIGWHFWNANFYRNEWMEVQGYFQQLIHRAPGLEPGTILLINDMPSIALYQDDSLTALLNWTYAPENKSHTLDYVMYYLSVRLGLDLPALEPGLPIEKAYRSLHFSSSTDHILVVHYQPPGCVRVLDGSNPDRLPLSLPEGLRAALPLSNFNMIKTDQSPPAQPPAHLFELSEAPNWCFSFQDAELAAQRGDWPLVAEIGDQAYARQDQANELTEHFVFIDGYLRAGRFERAYEVSNMLSERTQGEFDGRICSLWRSAERDLGGGFDLEVDFEGMLTRFCSSD